MLREMSGRHLVEWMNFWDLEGGFGEERMDTRFGAVVMTLNNVNRGRKSTRSFKLSECTPKFGDGITAPQGKAAPGAKKDWRWMKAMAKAMAGDPKEKRG